MVIKMLPNPMAAILDSELDTWPIYIKLIISTNLSNKKLKANGNYNLRTSIILFYFSSYSYASDVKGGGILILYY